MAKLYPASGAQGRSPGYFSGDFEGSYHILYN
jgi:hypothetical protein